MYFLMLPFVILGSIAKITNNRIQKNINSTKTYLELQGASVNELKKNSKERKLTEITR
jgi:hypothetical protein